MTSRHVGRDAGGNGKHSVQRPADRLDVALDLSLPERLPVDTATALLVPARATIRAPPYAG
jgi:hypothetical protein